MRTFFAVLVLSLLPLLAAKAIAAGSCDAVLVDGTMQRSTVQKSSYEQLVVAERISQQTWEQAKHTLAVNGGISIPGIGSLSAQSSEAEFHSFINAFKQSYDFESIRKNEASVITASGDPIVLGAWTACIARDGGWETHIKPAGEDLGVAYATVAFTWWPYPLSPNYRPRITARLKAQPRGDVVAGGEIDRLNVKIEPRIENSVIVEYPKGRSLSVRIGTTAGAITAYLPFIPAPVIITKKDEKNVDRPSPPPPPTIYRAVYAAVEPDGSGTLSVDSHFQHRSMTNGAVGWTVVQAGPTVYRGAIPNCNEGWLSLDQNYKGCAGAGNSEFWGALMTNEMQGRSLPVIEVTQEFGPACTKGSLALASSRCPGKSAILGYLRTDASSK